MRKAAGIPIGRDTGVWPDPTKEGHAHKQPLYISPDGRLGLVVGFGNSPYPSVNTSGMVSVINIVCSNWADSLPSMVRAVQPSLRSIYNPFHLYIISQKFRTEVKPIRPCYIAIFCLYFLKIIFILQRSGNAIFYKWLYI